MGQVLITELIVATFMMALVSFLGWHAQNKGTGGAVLPALAAGISSLLTIAGSMVGYAIAENTGSWIGLFVGMCVSILIVPRPLTRFFRAQSVRPVTILMGILYALVVWGYLVAGLVGVFAFVISALLIFLTILRRLSRYVLPLSEEMEKSDLGKVFRCIVTYSLGTNHPCFVVQNGKVEKRIDGNPFRQFFAGPGIVFVAPDHAGYVTDGVRVTQIVGPGISFTRLYDQQVRPVDLRSQLRAFHVEALTKDGINIRVLVFLPFRLHCRKQQPTLGGAFPVSEQAVFQLARSELIERLRGKKGSERHQLDGDLVPVVVTPIVQDVIGRYEVDDLCAPTDGDRDPRVEIAEAVKRRARIALRAYGVEVIGGGISNLNPMNEDVPKRRLENWKTKWENRVLGLMSEVRAESARQVEMARLEAELQVVRRFSQIKLASNLSEDVTQAAIALSFVDCLGQMLHESELQWPLPDSLRNSLAKLRGQLEQSEG